MNNYSRNLETQKIELHFEKSTYMALPDETKKKIKSNFLWSNYAKGWVSRAKGNNAWHAEQIAKELNLTFDGETGEKLTFAEQIEREQNRAADRAERMEERAEKAEQRSTSAYETAKEIGSFIPFGQPILVGHHSEGRHRRDINRIDNAMRKSCEESDKAKYYEDKAETAKRTAEGAQYTKPTYLSNRIKEARANLSKLNRYKEGKVYSYSEPKPISEEYANRLDIRIAEETEKLNFFTEKLAALGEIHTKESLKAAKVTHVKRRGTWYPIKSLNAQSVTILNWISIGTWTWKCTYEEIQGTKTAEDMMVINDRDGNEVKPTIKYK